MTVGTRKRRQAEIVNPSEGDDEGSTLVIAPSVAKRKRVYKKKDASAQLSEDAVLPAVATAAVTAPPSTVISNVPTVSLTNEPTRVPFVRGSNQRKRARRHKLPEDQKWIDPESGEDYDKRVLECMPFIEENYLKVDQLSHPDSLYIPQPRFRELLAKYADNPEVVSDSISLLVQKYNIALPFPSISQEEIDNNYYKLRHARLDDLVEEKQWMHRTAVDWSVNPYNYRPLTINRKRMGSRALQSIHAPFRARISTNMKRSMVEGWSIPYVRRIGLHTLKQRTQEGIPVTWNICYHAFSCYIDACSHFRPAVARAIFEMYKPKSVYDFSAGWGDRYAAALATPSVTLYHGNDPNPDVHQIYQRIWNELPHDRKPTTFTSIFTREGAEEYYPTDRKYDMVFSSPPYYHVEAYQSFGSPGSDAKQAWKKFQTYEEWIHGFLAPAIRNAWECVAVGGHLVINIGDFTEQVTHQPISVQEVIYNLMKQLPHSDDCGAIGMELNHRPNSVWKEISHDLTYAEPVWIFKKIC